MGIGMRRFGKVGACHRILGSPAPLWWKVVWAVALAVYPFVLIERCRKGGKGILSSFSHNIRACAGDEFSVVFLEHIINQSPRWRNAYKTIINKFPLPKLPSSISLHKIACIEVFRLMRASASTTLIARTVIYLTTPRF